METTVNDFFNVAIFIDYENVHKTLLNRNKNAIRLGFFEKLKKWCKDNNRRIVKIAVYCNFDNKDLYESHHQSFLQSYGVETIHTSNQGKNYADLKLAIDVLNSMYTNDNIDEFIIMSNDKDMTPLLNTVRLNKRKASILTTGNTYNHTLCEFADEQIEFDKIVEIEYKGTLLIDEIKDRFFDDIKKHIEKSLYEYSTEGSKGYKKHYNLDYFLITQMDYYNVLKYEMLNIVSILYSEKKIIAYSSHVKNNVLPAIIPTEFKEKFLEFGIIQQSDICSNFDFNKSVLECYDNYKPKDKN